MNSKIPDDLFSAFLDREVTSAEEAAALARLQASPQAKQELQDYQRLSEWLHELPRQTVPPEFAAAVMQRAERETLIPLDANAIVECDSHLERPSRRTWIFTIAGVAAIAVAALFFATLPGRQNQPAAVVARNEASPLAVARSNPASVAFAPAPKPALVVRKTTGGRPLIESRVVPEAHVAFGLDSQGGGTSAMRGKSVGGNTPQLVFPANLKTAQLGEVIEALENVGEQVAVVRLRVVNQAAGLDGVQNLLVRDTSRTVQNADELKVLRKRFTDKKEAVAVDGSKTPNSTGDLICVFVEGTREQLAGVLKDVQNESQIQQAQLTNTISAAKLAQYANRPGAPALQSRNQSAAGSQDIMSLPVATVEKILSENEPGRKQTVDLKEQEELRFEQTAPTQAAPTQVAPTQTAPTQTTEYKTTQNKTAQPGDGSNSAAYQYQGKPAASPSSVAQMRQDSISPRTAGAKKDAGGKAGARQAVAAAQRSYQVFFVLDDASIAQSQSAPAPPIPAETQSLDQPQPSGHRRRPVVARRPVTGHVSAPAKRAD
jgi:hypothetical protein